MSVKLNLGRILPVLPVEPSLSGNCPWVNLAQLAQVCATRGFRWLVSTGSAEAEAVIERCDTIHCYSDVLFLSDDALNHKRNDQETKSPYPQGAGLEWAK